MTDHATRWKELARELRAKLRLTEAELEDAADVAIKADARRQRAEADAAALRFLYERASREMHDSLHTAAFDDCLHSYCETFRDWTRAP